MDRGVINMTVLKNSILVFFILIFCISPFAIMMLPVATVLITNNINWLWFFSLSLPIGISLLQLFVEKGFDWAFDNFGDT
jgi:hypothetical protein